MPLQSAENLWKWTKLSSTNKLLVSLLLACIVMGYGIVHIYSRQVAALEKQVAGLEKQNEAKDNALLKCREEKDLNQQQQIDYLKEQAKNKKEAKK